MSADVKMHYLPWTPHWVVGLAREKRTLQMIKLCFIISETCGSQVVYSGEADVRSQGLGSNIEDPASCFSTIAEMQRCIITLEQEHLQYLHFLQSRTVVGSV